MTDAAAVAIVGMSGRFPGSPTLGEYWANLRAGVCSISDFTAQELAADGVAAEEFGHADYVPAKGFLAGADRFEAELFGFNPTEAEVLDPQHRLLLETAWRALEDAGYDPRRAPERTGVYVGGGPSEHMIAASADRRLAAELGAMQVRTLTDREFLAAWLSYRFGLDGPSLTVQTACATSLTALHLAVQGLLLGECDAALVGGVALDSVRRRGYLHQEGGILSRDGRCRPFDERASGTVPGNGVGMLVLRRLEDAVATGDPVRAVVRGSAVTNDGAAKLGFTAPSVDRQSAAIVEAWAAAGLSPSAAQYLEAHGTATQLGDRIEVAAMKAALGDSGGRCALGSVKSNIGHLDSAAGVAALIKVVLMLEHRTLVPSANVTRAHPELGLKAGPLRLLTEPAAWASPPSGPRLAGISGVAIGGTNVHVVLAEAPATTRPSTRPADGPELLPLSARTPQQLSELARRMAEAFESADAPRLADAGHTLRNARSALAVRACVVADDAGRAAESFRAVAAGRTPPVPAAAGAPLAAVAEAWTRGQDVTWPGSVSGARRTHLPTYPFAGRSRGAWSLPVAGGVPPAADETATSTGSADGPVAPLDTVAAVLELLRTTLGLTSGDELDQSYFAAGGDSLTAVHLVGRLRDEHRIDVPVEVFLESLSIRELARRIAGGAEHGGATLLESLLDEVEGTG